MGNVQEFYVTKKCGIVDFNKNIQFYLNTFIMVRFNEIQSTYMFY